MDSLVIRGVSGSVLEFMERTPTDRHRPVERFLVRYVQHDVTAVARVYTFNGRNDASLHPGSLFAEMTAQWKGWQGEIVWESQERELSLSGACDRAGHVYLRVGLRSGPTENDWSVRATVEVQAGQLDEIAREAAAFFG